MTSYIYDMVDTWNAGATTFTAVKMNVTDTASASGSLLMDLQVGGSSRFNITKAGVVNLTGTQQVGFGSTSNTLDFYAQNTQFVRLTQTEFRLSTGSLAFGPSVTGSDLYLTRRAAANLRLGAADAAAPVAQTLSVQSVVAGTTNTAGANLTITGSQGTGTGAGGSIVFQVAPAGSSGTAQNALATALTIDGTGTNVTFAQRASFGASTVFIERESSVRMQVSVGGNPFAFTNSGFSAGSSAFIGFRATQDITAAVDTYLYRDDANKLALRNGANAQTFRVYNTYTSDTNYESGRLQWVGNEFRIGPETVGGTLRSMGLYVGGTRYQIIGSNFNQFDQAVYMNGANIATDTSTGFKIGTGTTQKIGFWNATPIVQPTTAVAAATVAATGTGDVVAASTTFDGYTIPQIVKALRNAGLLA